MRRFIHSFFHRGIRCGLRQGTGVKPRGLGATAMNTPAAMAAITETTRVPTRQETNSLSGPATKRPASPPSVVPEM